MRHRLLAAEPVDEGDGQPHEDAPQSAGQDRQYEMQQMVRALALVGNGPHSSTVDPRGSGVPRTVEVT